MAARFGGRGRPCERSHPRPGNAARPAAVAVEEVQRHDRRSWAGGAAQAAEDASAGGKSGQPISAFSLTALRGTPRYTYLVAAVAALGGMLFGSTSA